jgi:hypothetical protein
MHYLNHKITPDIKKIGLFFLLWKIFLYLSLVIAFCFIPLGGKNFFGGGLELYNQFPYLLAWANFDGEHYMSIAMNGYQSLEQAFFPDEKNKKLPPKIIKTNFLYRLLHNKKRLEKPTTNQQSKMRF